MPPATLLHDEQANGTPSNEEIEINPYASPNTLEVISARDQTERFPLASRLSRFVAVIIDFVLLCLVLMPAIFAESISGEDSSAFAIAVACSGVGILLFMVYQWYLLARVGQTLGKKIQKIRVVNYIDDENPGFLRAVFLRTWFAGGIGAIPVIGPLFGLADVLFILGDKKRCLHDRLAGTKVISLR